LTVNTTTDASVTEQVDAYSTTLIAQLQGSPVVVDETFAVAPNDPMFQAAIAAAETTLKSDGAISIAGPTLASSTNSSNTSSQTVDTILSQSLSFQSETYVGPLTLYVGTNQSEAFTLTAGQTDTDTLLTNVISNLATTTTTTTDTITQVYDLIGTSGQSVAAPEINPASAVSALTLLIGSLWISSGRRRREKRE
jgi:hypothetical protein